MKKLLSFLVCVCLLFQLTATVGFASEVEESTAITLDTPVVLSFSGVGDTRELTWQPPEAGDYTFTIAGDGRVSIALLITDGADNIYIGGGNATFTETIGAYESVTVRAECIGAPESACTLTVTAAGEPEPEPEPVDLTLALNAPKTLTFAQVGDNYRLTLPSPAAGDYAFTIAGDCQVFVSLFVVADNDNISIGSGNQTFALTLEEAYKEMEVCVECVGNPDNACTITVTMEPLEVKPVLTDVSVSVPPTKVTYLKGRDTLDVTGGKVKLIYSDESFEEIDMTADMVTGFDNTRVGEQTLTVTYEGLTATFNVTVKSLRSITCIGQPKPDKVTYFQGQGSLDLTGGVLLAVYDDGSSEQIPLTDPSIEVDDSEFDINTIGTYHIWIGYGNQSCVIGVEVVALAVDTIDVSQMPTKVDYLEGKDTLDVTGGKVKLNYNDGSSQEIDMTADMVTGFDNTQVGEQTLTVTYEGLTATFCVGVYAKSLVSIAVTTLPTKLTYVEGDGLVTTGMVVTATYDNDEKVEVSDWDVAFSLDTAGPATVYVIYEDKSTTFEVDVDHDYADATCTEPKTCTWCGDTTGNALGHDYAAATCTAPKTCKVCKTPSGSALGHKYTNACDTSCNTCGATRSITHAYKTTTTKATLTKSGSIVKKCSVCGDKASTTAIRYAKTVKLSTISYTYNGKAMTPSVTVKDSAGKALKKNTDYTVTYASGRKNVGTYKVTIKGKGNYSFTKTLTFTINPPKTTVKSLTAGTKSLKVSIAKKSSQVTGYEVQYSTSKKFTKATTKAIKSYKTTSYTLKSLSAKKTYYVRVRTYKTVNGKKYYSGWSSYKYKKTK